MARTPLLELTTKGLYCPTGDFFIDPWQPVDRAVITHAHGDHLTRGCSRYLMPHAGEALSRLRLGSEAHLQTLPYREILEVNGVKLSFHPSGHILGAAQIRLEVDGQVGVVSGDYKRQPDPTCVPFELVPCHLFVTESTFGLPIFRWPEPGVVINEINDWWRSNQQQGKASLLLAYPLGKSQRILASIDTSIGPIFTHGAVERLNDAYRASGAPIPETRLAISQPKGAWSKALIIAPPSAHNSPWSRRFGAQSTAFASGWMRIRGTRRRRAIDRGFVLSDHADWPALLATIKDTGASQVWVTHGYTASLSRWLHENGYEVQSVESNFRPDLENNDPSVNDEIET